MRETDRQGGGKERSRGECGLEECNEKGSERESIRLEKKGEIFGR